MGAVVVGEAELGLVEGAWDSRGQVGILVVGASVGAASVGCLMGAHCVEGSGRQEKEG